MSERAPVSPCIGVCTLDPQSHFCIGCARSIDEIAQWPRLSAEAKRRVIADLVRRRPQSQDQDTENRPRPDLSNRIGCDT